LDEAAVFEIVGRKGVRYFYQWRIWEAEEGEKAPRLSRVTKLKAQKRAHIAAHILEASTEAARANGGEEVEFEQIVYTWLRL
jgi:hypothetical protein